jgi:hypothetical protein
MVNLHTIVSWVTGYCFLPRVKVKQILSGNAIVSRPTKSLAISHVLQYVKNSVMNCLR